LQCNAIISFNFAHQYKRLKSLYNITMKQNWVAYAALFAANLIYGANFTIAKMVMPQFIKPLGFTFIRVLGSVVFFFLVHTFFIKEKIQKADLPRIILSGLFGISINQILFLEGLNLTTPVNASLIMITTPILVMLISVFSLKEKITWYKVLGVLLGAAGAFYTIGGNELEFSSQTALGDFYIFLNAIAYGIYLSIVKPLMKKYNAITVLNYIFLFGYIPVFFIGLSQFQEVDWAAIPYNKYWAIFYVVFIVNCGAYLFNIYALGKVNPSVVGIFIYLQPIFATLIAIVFHSDVLSIEKIVAALLIFSGVYMVSFFKPIKLKQRLT
jgi:drug/metabolite transporter (DMT)-like permease